MKWFILNYPLAPLIYRALALLLTNIGELRNSTIFWKPSIMDQWFFCTGYLRCERWTFLCWPASLERDIQFLPPIGWFLRLGGFFRFQNKYSTHVRWKMNIPPLYHHLRGWKNNVCLLWIQLVLIISHIPCICYWTADHRTEFCKELVVLKPWIHDFVKVLK